MEGVSGSTLSLQARHRQACALVQWAIISAHMSFCCLDQSLSALLHAFPDVSRPSGGTQYREKGLKLHMRCITCAASGHLMSWRHQMADDHVYACMSSCRGV